jgi:Fe-S cluster biosynthesis and repair protein YggX
VVNLATILIKNLPDELLKELKRLKVELGCRTWAELLAKLVESRTILLNEDRLEEMRIGVRGFLKLRDVVSSKWVGHPTVLEETRRSRGHGAE